MQYAITTQQLGKSFKGKEVIHTSNMSVEYGTIYGLLGRNGAGKTTIFKILFFLTEKIYPLCPDKMDFNVVVYSCVMLVYNSIMAGFIGMISLWFGFLQKSVSTTIVSSCIIVTLLCQLIAQTIIVPEMEYLVMIGIFTVILVIVILLHRNLCHRVEKMEV